MITFDELPTALALPLADEGAALQVPAPPDRDLFMRVVGRPTTTPMSGSLRIDLLQLQDLNAIQVQITGQVQYLDRASNEATVDTVGLRVTIAKVLLEAAKVFPRQLVLNTVAKALRAAMLAGRFPTLSQDTTRRLLRRIVQLFEGEYKAARVSWGQASDQLTQLDKQLKETFTAKNAKPEPSVIAQIAADYPPKYVEKKAFFEVQPPKDNVYGYKVTGIEP